MFTNCGLNDIVKMTSFNQAKLLKRGFDLGSIKKGYIADMVLLKPDMTVAMTVCDGRICVNENNKGL